MKSFAESIKNNEEKDRTMTWYDWLIALIPTVIVLGVGLYSTRYVKGVVDFLSADRLCGRYVLPACDSCHAFHGYLVYIQFGRHNCAGCDIAVFQKRPGTAISYSAVSRRAMLIGIGFVLVSAFMVQLDYFQLFITIILALWLGGCGPMCTFALYGRFGTRQGA